MTVEIFRDDAYARTTEAQILAGSDDGIVLDQTVFYPEGGGQPGDRGSIILGDDSAITIVDTHKNQAGTLLHIPAAGQSMPAVNDRVTASIDWDYRYRHMRTHTCLHLLTDEEMENNMDLVRTMSVKPPMGQDRVRLVEIGGVDLQPCGGTHVARTGEIGEVRIGKVEKKGKHNRRVNIHLE